MSNDIESINNINFNRIQFRSLYSASLSTSVRRGMQAKLERGGINGKAPFGYLNDTADRIVVEDPTWFGIVRQNMSDFARGEIDIAGFVDNMNTAGYRNRSGTPMSEGKAYRMLSDIRYAGYVCDKNKKRSYKAQHKPMITVAEYAEIQNRIGWPYHLLRAANR